MTERQPESVASRDRPHSDRYFMEIAFVVPRRAVCLSRKVGAVLVLNDRIIAAVHSPFRLFAVVVSVISLGPHFRRVSDDAVRLRHARDACSPDVVASTA
jgi:hypothetical protein